MHFFTKIGFKFSFLISSLQITDIMQLVRYYININREHLKRYAPPITTAPYSKNATIARYRAYNSTDGIQRIRINIYNM